ncbi:hypothetical protein EJB05_55625, partial [Eragrostis curvula]
MARLIEQLPLLLLLLLAAPAGTGCSTGCPSSIYDHTVNKDGGIEFPVFHRNHLCARSFGAAGEMDQTMGTSINVIGDSSVNSFAFLMPIVLGTPPIMNLVAFDTGSTLPWVQCRPCTVKCHDQLPKAGQIFDPSKSSTFRSVPCLSRDCLELKSTLRLELATCRERENSCLYSLTYGDGWASTVGKVGRDKLLIGHDEALIFELMFGCSLDTVYSDYEAGIIGFGSSKFSFFEQVSTRINYKAFSYCLPSDEAQKGYMILGDYNRGSVDEYTALFPSSGRPTYSLTMNGLIVNGHNLIASSSEMIVDSGSWWTILSPDTFDLLDEVITEALAFLDYQRSYERGSQYICFISRADSLNWRGVHTAFSDWSSLPLVEITFAGTASLTVPAENLFQNNEKHGLCTSFLRGSNNMLPQVLGNRVNAYIWDWRNTIMHPCNRKKWPVED